MVQGGLESRGLESAAGLVLRFKFSMKKTLKSLKRAVKVGMQAAAEPIEKHKRYRLVGRRVKCSHCEGELFEEGATLEGMFMGSALQCVNCGKIELFGRSVEEE